jgi:hypothetical protein
VRHDVEREKRIAVLRGALKGHVQSSLELVATLTELAEKDPTNEIHVKLLHAQKKLAEQKRRLARLNAEHRVFIGELGGAVRRGI